MKRHLYEHLTLSRHSGFLHDVSIILIDKAAPSCCTRRKGSWVDTLKIKAPMGLSVDFEHSF